MKEKNLSDLSTFDPMLKDTPVSKGHKDIKFKTKNQQFPELRTAAIKAKINKDYNG